MFFLFLYVASIKDSRVGWAEILSAHAVLNQRGHKSVPTLPDSSLHPRQILSRIASRILGVNFHPDAVDMRDQVGIFKLPVLR